MCADAARRPFPSCFLTCSSIVISYFQVVTRAIGLGTSLATLNKNGHTERCVRGTPLIVGKRGLPGMEVQSDENLETPVSVCMIVENLPVPADRRVWQEACALAEAGYQVSVICPKAQGFEQSRETRNGIEIYRHRTWEASSKFGYFLEYGWAMTAEFILAVRIYRNTRFRVLQACNPPDTIFLIALFFKLWGVRFIFDHHDPTPELDAARFARQGSSIPIVTLC